MHLQDCSPLLSELIGRIQRRREVEKSVVASCVRSGIDGKATIENKIKMFIRGRCSLTATLS